jgi:hypothetical protein
LQAFDEGDPKADENIRSIESGTQLLDAVKACVNAVRHFQSFPCRHAPRWSLMIMVWLCVRLWVQALSEWDESKQQAYLKAAAYGTFPICLSASISPHFNLYLFLTPSPLLVSAGKGFLDEDPEHSSALDADEFVAKCRKLRVLNNLRFVQQMSCLELPRLHCILRESTRDMYSYFLSPRWYDRVVRRAEVGLPLTAGQYDRLSPHAIIERLTLRRQHFLALKISDYLRYIP